MKNLRIPEKICGIIGYPLGHSLSPLLHNTMFEELNIAMAYTAWPLAPENVSDFMIAFRTLPIWGASVTIPHKIEVMDNLDWISPMAQKVGAVNTLYWQHDTLCGENTDIIGFLAPLKAADFRPEHAVVIGAGGASRAAIAGLQELGAEVTVVARNIEKARILAEDMGCGYEELHAAANAKPDLVVNATPLGMKGENEGKTPWPAEAMTHKPALYDLVYNPLETEFLRLGREQGCTCHDGLTMFIEQAAEQFRLWTGKQMPRQSAREVLTGALYS